MFAAKALGVPECIGLGSWWKRFSLKHRPLDLPHMYVQHLDSKQCKPMQTLRACELDPKIRPSPFVNRSPLDAGDRGRADF